MAEQMSGRELSWRAFVAWRFMGSLSPHSVHFSISRNNFFPAEKISFTNLSFTQFIKGCCGGAEGGGKAGGPSEFLWAAFLATCRNVKTTT